MLDKVKSLPHTIVKRMIAFIIIFVVLGTSNYFFDYVFRPLKVDLLRELSSSFGMAFGICFVDIIFLRKRSNH
ncbi:hypothetical protein LGL08_09770 [Clostridium estertheticum]|uniref:hypothetical protein n=1 Tax=Clostridium estertheticum TaxID=238834 RepID=UPI001CF2FD04|nr:hypothetical protein [Clostridium estertheticum]MCB2307349.1 hypothetical protein [Clostridium estertheticum]MCB2344999.1 hypothetical protein [Clostridium estertheticum]MCB2349839.1 hypothetical protein [Clostridium estertheticum]WAG48235.1 hypothetical protein LL127_21525 [Clostridium estertheticum]